jgi:phosphate transport system substrate-binding protein
MKNIKNVLFVLSILFIMGMVCMGCESKKEDSAKQSASSPGQKLQGIIRVSGAWALYPMMVKWAEEFSKIHPEIRVDVSAGGAGKGVADALAGLVDIGMVSREIRSEEIQNNAFYVPVVKDAVFATVNEANPVLAKGLLVKGLKKKTFYDLWITGKSMTWGEVVGMPSKDRIQVYTRSDSCGAAEIWAKYLEGKAQEDLKGIGVYGDPGVAEAVKKDAFGIGFNNLNYAYDAKSGLPLKGIQLIPIDVNENGRVDDGEKLSNKKQAMQAVMSGSYPSPPARDLYILSNGKFKGLSKEFVKWILTDGQKFVEEVGYIRPADDKIKTALAKIEDQNTK